MHLRFQTNIVFALLCKGLIKTSAGPKQAFKEQQEMLILENRVLWQHDKDPFQVNVTFFCGRCVLCCHLVLDDNAPCVEASYLSRSPTSRKRKRRPFANKKGYCKKRRSDLHLPRAAEVS